MTRIALADLPDVLTGSEAAAAIGISERQYYRLKRHGLFPIRPLKQPGDPRYAKSAVQQHLDDRRRSS